MEEDLGLERPFGDDFCLIEGNRGSSILPQISSLLNPVCQVSSIKYQSLGLSKSQAGKTKAEDTVSILLIQKNESLPKLVDSRARQVASADLLLSLPCCSYQSILRLVIDLFFLTLPSYISSTSFSSMGA